MYQGKHKQTSSYSNSTQIHCSGVCFRTLRCSATTAFNPIEERCVTQLFVCLCLKLATHRVVKQIQNQILSDSRRFHILTTFSRRNYDKTYLKSLFYIPLQQKTKKNGLIFRIIFRSTYAIKIFFYKNVVRYL